MYTVDPPAGPRVATNWPGALLVMAHMLAVLTAEGLARRGPEPISPGPAPHDGALLFVDHRTGRAGALPLYLKGPAVDLGPATRIMGSTADRLAFVVDHAPEAPLTDPYDVADEWEYQERLAGTYGGQDVVRAVSLDTGALVLAEVHRQDLRDPHDWAAVRVLRDGRLVLRRSPPDSGDTATEIALCSDPTVAGNATATAPGCSASPVRRYSSPRYPDPPRRRTRC